VFVGIWQLPLTKFNVGYCRQLDINTTMDMIVQSFPGLIELVLACLDMEALPEGEWATAQRLWAVGP